MLLEKSKEEIILIEIQEERPEIKHYVLDENETKFNCIKALNLKTAYDYNGDKIATYDYNTNSTDLSNFKDKVGCVMVLVSINTLNEFVWTYSIIEDISDDCRVIKNTPFIECTNEEMIVLDELFPLFRERCKEYTIKMNKRKS